MDASSSKIVYTFTLKWR